MLSLDWEFKCPSLCCCGEVTWLCTIGVLHTQVHSLLYIYIYISTNMYTYVYISVCPLPCVSLVHARLGELRVWASNFSSHIIGSTFEGSADAPVSLNLCSSRRGKESPLSRCTFGMHLPCHQARCHHSPVPKAEGLWYMIDGGGVLRSF